MSDEVRGAARNLPAVEPGWEALLDPAMLEARLVDARTRREQALAARRAAADGKADGKPAGATRPTAPSSAASSSPASRARAERLRAIEEELANAPDPFLARAPSTTPSTARADSTGDLSAAPTARTAEPGARVEASPTAEPGARGEASPTAVRPQTPDPEAKPRLRAGPRPLPGSTTRRVEAAEPAETAGTMTQRLATVIVRKQTEASPATARAGEGHSAAGRPLQPRAPRPRTIEERAVEARAAESRPAESRPVEPRPVESRPVESRPVESQPVEFQPTELGPAVGGSRAAARPRRQRPVWAWAAPALGLAVGAGVALGIYWWPASTPTATAPAPATATAPSVPDTTATASRTGVGTLSGPIAGPVSPAMPGELPGLAALPGPAAGAVEPDALATPVLSRLTAVEPLRLPSIEAATAAVAGLVSGPGRVGPGLRFGATEPAPGPLAHPTVFWAGVSGTPAVEYALAGGDLLRPAPVAARTPVAPIPVAPAAAPPEPQVATQVPTAPVETPAVRNRLERAVESMLRGRIFGQ
ncbi:hypothetical protein HNP73_000584 [Amaricoccus macauensis]|uniref:Uncharacterized protein n=1 Tax=Amaricoccus macauensis TaxID=57001 RepID=A0A840SMJ3_9RHOB|nr:hypothetical protein [Amaricoccus macauensis]MBB5220663.1 hypothetical protein [Amaricoccus macauensis]